MAITGATLRDTGSPGGFTGSPMDGQNCTMCHTSFVAQTVPNLISADIPQQGYESGQRYQITVTGSHTGATTMGFELTAESGDGKAGTFTVSSGSTRLVNSDNAVTHTNQGVAASGGSRTWTVNWTAPATGTGNVTFYVAVNGGNGNSVPAGDQIYLSSLTVSERSVTAARLQALANTSPFFYPNPATDYLYMTGSGQGVIAITDLSGNLLIEQPDAARIDLGSLASGAYFIKKIEGGRTRSAIFIKK